MLRSHEEFTIEANALAWARYLTARHFAVELSTRTDAIGRTWHRVQWFGLNAAGVF